MYGSIWEYMGVYGSIWEYMGVYGSIWEYMGVYGDGIFFWLSHFQKVRKIRRNRRKSQLGLNDLASNLPPNLQLPACREIWGCGKDGRRLDGISHEVANSGSKQRLGVVWGCHGDARKSAWSNHLTQPGRQPKDH